MARNLDKTNITQGQTINSWDVTQSIDAFSGTEEYDIILSGSLTLTGSLYLDPNKLLTVTQENFLAFDTSTGQIFYNDFNIIRSGSFSGSFEGDGSGFTGLPVGNITRVNITAGIGLTGDQDTTSGDHTQTIDLEFSTLTDMTGDIAGTTEFIIQNGSTESRKAASEIQLGFFNNNLSWTSNTGDITQVNITTSTGLDGTLNTTSGDHVQTISLEFSGLPLGDALVGTDWLIANNSNVESRQVISSIPLGIFNNDLRRSIVSASTAFTVTPTDSTTIRKISGGTFNVTVNSSSLSNIGDTSEIENYGSGTITIYEGNATLKVNSSATLVMDGQYSRVAIQKMTATEYRVFGELTPS